MMEDITARKRAERILRESEEKYRTLVSEINDGFFVTDDSGKILYANMALARIHGFESPQELIGRTVFDFIAPGERDAVAGDFRRAVETGQGTEIIEVPIIVKEKNTVFIEIKPTLVKDGDRIIGTRGVIRDITERKLAEEAIKRYSKELEEANKLKDIFTDIMRHDLLNPAGVIKTAAEILLEEVKEEDARDTVYTAKRSAERLIEMIESASTYAKIENSDKMKFEKLDLNKIITSAVDNLKTMLNEKNMDLVYLPKGEFYAIANPIIESVFTNLISNAIKYSPEGQKIGAMEYLTRTREVYFKDSRGSTKEA